MVYTVDYSNRPEERPGSHLLLILHGYGAHEADLSELAGSLSRPGFTLASLRAPQPVGAQPDPHALSAYMPANSWGYQWYPLDAQLRADLEHIERAVDYVLGFIDQDCGSYRAISLLGFSQGMAVASSLIRSRPEKFASLIGLSGYIVEQDSSYFKDQRLAELKLPAFYGRGGADQVIPPEFVRYSQKWLQEHTRLYSQVYPQMAHSISPVEIGHIADFMQTQLA